MKLTILNTNGYRLLSVAAIVDVFETVNRYLVADGKAPLFEINFVGLEEAPNLDGSFSDYQYYPVRKVDFISDLVFVPAFSSRNMPQLISENSAFVPFLQTQNESKSVLVSLCTGSFLLAASGLLNGKPATTHIEAAGQFSEAFPEVNIQPHAIITESENVYTSGGATSSFHLKLHLIQKICGRTMAIRIAKNFAIDLDRNNQLYFEQFKPGLVEDDELVRSVQEFINHRYSQIKSIEEALEEVPSSRRNIIRRFKQSTGITPIRYLQKTRIEAAKKLLETTNKDILDVMISSGYNDMKNFRNLFKSFTGLTPSSYREKYGMRLG